MSPPPKGVVIEIDEKPGQLDCGDQPIGPTGPALLMSRDFHVPYSPPPPLDAAGTADSAPTTVNVRAKDRRGAPTHECRRELCVNRKNVKHRTARRVATSLARPAQCSWASSLASRSTRIASGGTHSMTATDDTWLTLSIRI